jgi:exodeoxyribonuclease VII small subunit
MVILRVKLIELTLKRRTKMSQEQNYNDAFNELQGIVEDIRESKVDIDELASKVKKARELIDVCKNKIKKSEVEVEKITKNLIEEK